MDRTYSHIAIAREVQMNKSSITWRGAGGFAGAIALAAFSLGPRAENVVEAVSGSTQGGSEVVRIDFSQPLEAVPPGFAIQAPARVALDIPGVTNGMGRSSVELNQGNVR